MNVFVDGSYNELFVAPKNGSYCVVPPAMKTRPSGRVTMPSQNMSKSTGCVVMFPVFGSQSALSKSVLPNTFPDPVTIRTLPLRISAA